MALRELGLDVRILTNRSGREALSACVPESRQLTQLVVEASEDQSRAQREEGWYGELIVGELDRSGWGAEYFLGARSAIPSTRSLKSVCVVHDVLFVTHSQYFDRNVRNLYFRNLARASREADKIIAVSEFSARSYEQIFARNVDAVVPLAPGVGDGETVDAAVSDQHKEERDFILAPGMNNRRKGLSVLLAAYHVAHQRWTCTNDVREKFPRLVATNVSTRRADEVSSVDCVDCRAGVRLMRSVSSLEMESLYARTSCVVYPTAAEGFGMPVLEGMQSGVPVICTDLPVLREVGGDAPFYFDVGNVSGLAECLSLALRDTRSRNAKVALGLDRSSNFTWVAAAQATVEVLCSMD